MTWTISEARSVACPKCKSPPGTQCLYKGKGAAKARREGRSHQPRIDAMVSARKAPGAPYARHAGRFAVTIWTDGSCLRNPGRPGGWAAIIVRHCENGGPAEITGCSANTTNNRMELMAVIGGLESLTEVTTALVKSDSRYVIDGITKWISGWKRRGWQLKTGGEVKNSDLWKRLDAAASMHRVRFEWVKGHAGIPGNVRADRRAGEMALRAQRGGAAMV